MLALGLLWSKTTVLKIANVGEPAMWMEKLSQGVLRVLTPLGPRYLNPSFGQRLYLLWIFRNFETLPIKVLSLRQQRRIDAMCARHGFVSVSEPNGLWDTPLLGTLEQRPPVAEPRRPNRSVSDAVSPFAADLQQRS
jgi:hypothetical protein